MKIATAVKFTHSPSIIVVHHTDTENHGTYDPNFQSSINKAIETWIGNGFAPHYVIDHDGSVVKLGHESSGAQHASLSSWDGQTSLNFFSIGIEIVHTNNSKYKDSNDKIGIPTYTETYTQNQYDSLVNLLQILTTTLNIPVYSIVGHSDVALSNGILGRKSGDPGIKLDWRN